jgi:hypothetical protein
VPGKRDERRMLSQIAQLFPQAERLRHLASLGTSLPATSSREQVRTVVRSEPSGAQFAGQTRSC